MYSGDIAPSPTVEEPELTRLVNQLKSGLHEAKMLVSDLGNGLNKISHYSLPIHATQPVPELEPKTKTEELQRLIMITADLVDELKMRTRHLSTIV
jgi:hypothetical protein